MTGFDFLRFRHNWVKGASLSGGFFETNFDHRYSSPLQRDQVAGQAIGGY